MNVKEPSRFQREAPSRMNTATDSQLPVRSVYRSWEREVLQILRVTQRVAGKPAQPGSFGAGVRVWVG